MADVNENDIGLVLKEDFDSLVSEVVRYRGDLPEPTGDSYSFSQLTSLADGVYFLDVANLNDVLLPPDKGYVSGFLTKKASDSTIYLKFEDYIGSISFSRTRFITGFTVYTWTDLSLLTVHEAEDYTVDGDIDLALKGKEPALPTGGDATHFLRGDKVWVDFMGLVRGTALAGATFLTNSVVLVTDTILVAIGKLQAQITNLVIPRSSFIIAPSNAVNKTRADLVLAGTSGDAAAINTALTALYTLRGGGTQAIRVDFLGGDITAEVQIHCSYVKFHLHGNGVKIVGASGGAMEGTDVVSLTGADIIFVGFSITNSDTLYSNALSIGGANCKIIGNICSGAGGGLFNTGTNCTITGNNCSSSSYGSWGTS